MSLPSWLSKLVRWLRAGYPQGAPRHSYVPLLALMPSKAVEVEDLRQAGERSATAHPPTPRRHCGAVERT